MKRFLSVLVLAVFLAVGAQGCSLTYWDSRRDKEYVRTEFGLLGAPDGWQVHGLLPLYRGRVPVARPAEK